MAGLPMTVRELIDELQRQPNLDLPVQAVGKTNASKHDVDFMAVRGVTFEGPYVAIDLGYGETRKPW